MSSKLFYMSVYYDNFSIVRGLQTSRYGKIVIISIYLLLIFLEACNMSKPREVENSFYFWRTEFRLSKIEEEYLKQLNIKYLYIRFFDVDWNEHENRAVPLAELQVSDNQQISQNITPTVFITNRTFQNLPDVEIPDLASKMVRKIFKISEKFKSSKIQEIQLDCDWSETTKGKFFELIQQIKNQLISKKIILSATIRLHQYKYPQITGVPPVSKGMLMFYNMGKINDLQTQNSILDNVIAENYLKNVKSYPLKLDIALPIFAWGVLIRRGKVINLLQSLQETDLEQVKNYTKLKTNLYQVQESHYLNGIYLYKNDQIRIEKVEKNQLLKASKLLNSYIKNDSLRLTFYHLDEKLLKNFPSADLKKCADLFKK